MAKFSVAKVDVVGDHLGRAGQQHPGTQGADDHKAPTTRVGGLPVLIPSAIEARDGQEDATDMVTPGGPTDTGGRHEPATAGHDDPVSESADAAGLRVAFLTHGGELYGYARRSLGDPRAAEDVVQETFIRAWRARDRFDTNLGTLRTWLFTIARRVVIDHARARAIRQTEPLPADIAGTDDDVENAMVGWQVEEALSRLRPDHRQVLDRDLLPGPLGTRGGRRARHPRGDGPQPPLLRAAHAAPGAGGDGVGPVTPDPCEHFQGLIAMEVVGPAVGATNAWRSAPTPKAARRVATSARTS